jgi:DNA polymerase-1
MGRLALAFRRVILSCRFRNHMPMPTPLILVDGSSYLYRAFHALPPLSNSRGEATGAVYGVVNMLRKLLADYDPEYIAVVFDAKGRTFRDDLFADYKAQRAPMPEELAEQVEPLQQVVQAMGIPVLVVNGVEADDVIGTLSSAAVSEGHTCLISTGDKDMAQLVNARVTLVNTMTGKVLDSEGVLEKFGVPAERMVDYLALVGDKIDNIPGVPGIGPKTASRLLQEHASVDALIAVVDRVPGRTGEALQAHLDQLRLSRELARIRRDLPLQLAVADLRRRDQDIESLRDCFRRLEFKTWLAELPPPAAEEGGLLRHDTVLDQPALEHWLQRLSEAPWFALDTETTSLDYMQAELVGVSFAVVAGEAAYVPLAHRYPGVPDQLDREQVLERLRPLLEDRGRPKLGHNLKYDMSVLARHGIELRGIRFDTMLESYVLDSTATRHDLDSLALKYLGHRNIRFEDVAGAGRAQLRFDQVPIEQAAPYAAEDAEVALRLHQVLWPRVCREPRLRALLEEVEIPLVPVLSRMERCGVRVDRERLEAQSRELAARIADLRAQAYQAAGGEFNLDSPKQLQEILFDRLQLPVLQKTPKGQASTAEAVLTELALDYPLPRLLLEYRSLSKLRSTYTEKLPQRIDPNTGRVHTSYHQAVAATGRLSSSDPNLQNIPVRTQEGRRIRAAFVAGPGYRLVAADYSQIELRILAHLSGDERLRAAFAAGEDIHRATAAEVFGVALEAVTPEQRRRAKAINFGLVYGMSAFGLSRQLGLPKEEAQSYIERYFSRYPCVQAFMDRTRARARESGFVETLFGRRLHIPEIGVSNTQRRAQAERTAINAPMQGTAADIIKRAMIRCDQRLRDSSSGTQMIMQVHDELVFEVPEGRVMEVQQEARRIMEGAAELDVPLVVEVGAGDNWDEAH